MRRCPKTLPEIDEWSEITGDALPDGTWAFKRKWLSDYIGVKEGIDPDTGRNGWMKGEADHRATWDLFNLLDGRLDLESNGEMWPNAITPITCGVLLVDQETDSLIETVVYNGDNQIMGWIPGNGLSEQPLWWIETMHAVKRGRSRILSDHRKDMASSDGRDK